MNSGVASGSLSVCMQLKICSCESSLIGTMMNLDFPMQMMEVVINIAWVVNCGQYHPACEQAAERKHVSTLSIFEVVLLLISLSKCRTFSQCCGKDGTRKKKSPPRISADGET
jgi:hypothetical protein